ncbi:MAG: tetratricopeptide repeat protein [Acidobacteria bacterium]|nr:tetratricopeptide repeat protein [Acidobacteriota bacterium]
MQFFKRLTAVMVAVLLAAPAIPLEAKTKKGDKIFSEGRSHEQKKEWDQALASYQAALAEDPADILYQMAVEKTRFQAAQFHVEQGMTLRNQGRLGDALAEFERAYAISPGNAAANQEMRRTREMIEIERRRVEATGKEGSPEERALTPGEMARRANNEKLASILPVPELKPINQDPIRLRMNGSPKLLFETVAKLAGLNVIWDPEYQPQVKGNVPVEFDNATLEEALDYIAVLTKSYWKPLSPNTIFITMDNPNKRRDYEEQVAKVFYLQNVNGPQELQEIVNAVRSVADIQRFFPYNSQNAIIAKGSADQIALAGKILHDLDKPKNEVVVDIIVMEASTVYTRQLTSALASSGLNIPISFTPRSGLMVVQNANTTGTSTTGTTTTGTGTGTTDTTGTGTGTTDTTGTGTGTTTTSSNMVPLSNLRHLGTADWATVVPDALLQAVLSDARTKVMQSPQIRTVDSVKASLKIGDRQPTATGSFQPGIGGVGINPLVNTQFTYIDVGVNVELQTRVFDNDDVYMHLDLDISSVTGQVNLGGINQPIIGQRKVSQEIRVHDGQPTLLGGLTRVQDTKTVTGIPGLNSIPVLRRLFTGESVDRERQELLIALVPHIVRRPEFTAENLRGIAVGNAQSVHITYGRRPSETPAATPAPVPQAQAAPAAATPVTPPATAITTPAVPLNPASPTGPPATAPPMIPGQPAMAPPATAPPATAPPATAPPPAERRAAEEAPRPAGNAAVRFLPPQMTANSGGSITVALIIENASDAASAPITVRFDPKVLRLTDVGRGDFFASGGQTPAFTKNIQNDAGAAIISLSRPPETPGASGSGVLASLIFQAVAPGTTTVTAPNLTVRNTQQQPVFSGSPQMTVTVK